MPYEALIWFTPTPQGVVAEKVDAAQPSIDAVEPDLVGSAGQNLASFGCELIPALAFAKQRTAAARKTLDVVGEAAVAHEDPFLALLTGAEQGAEPGVPGIHQFQDLPVGAAQAVLDRRELLEVTEQRSP